MNLFTPKNTPSGKEARASLPAVTVKLIRKDGRNAFVFSGELTAHTLSGLEKNLPPAPEGQNLVFDLTALTRLDTAGALFLNLTADALRKAGQRCEFSGAGQAQALLLEKTALPEKPEKKGAPAPPAILVVCNAIGKMLYDVAYLVADLTAFFGRFLTTLASVALHPSRLRLTSLIFYMEQTGLRAVPIVCLLTFLIGLVVAYMGAQQLTMFGAQIFAVNLLEVTVMREMAVLITSIVVAGRSSSSFTAQIGAMVANEEVDALRSMGLDPTVLLVLPRVLALVLSLPLLVFLADIMALLGGSAALWMVMDMELGSFITQIESVAKFNNFFAGMVKTPFFAVAIGLVGCFHGFRASGSAESVGFLTTISVVQSIFIVILLDALFAIFFMNLGL